MVLRVYLQSLSTVSDAFYTFSSEFCRQHSKKTPTKPNITGSLEMTYDFKAAERKGQSWAQSTGRAQ